MSLLRAEIRAALARALGDCDACGAPATTVVAGGCTVRRACTTHRAVLLALRDDREAAYLRTAERTPAAPTRADLDAAEAG